MPSQRKVATNSSTPMAATSTSARNAAVSVTIIGPAMAWSAAMRAAKGPSARPNLPPGAMAATAATTRSITADSLP